MAARRRYRRRYRPQRRKGQWAGAHFRVTPMAVSPSVDATQLVLVAAESSQDNSCTMMGGYLTLNCRRDLVIGQYGQSDRAAFIVAKVQVDVSGAMQDILNPLSTDPFDLANPDILLWDFLSPDAVLVDSAEPQMWRQHYHIKAKRKLDRGSESIAFFVNATDVDIVEDLSVLWRSYLQY